MKVEVKYWGDSDNVDLVITAESATETALLGLLRNRQPRWSEASGSRRSPVEIIFSPAPEVTEKSR